jgi:hypothetical protein
MASSLLLSRITSAPESRNPLPDAHFSSVFDPPPRKRDLQMEGPSQRSPLGHSSPPPRHGWPAASLNPRSELGEPPDKRPRLEYQSDALVDSSTRSIAPRHVCHCGTCSSIVAVEAQTASPAWLLLTVASLLVQSFPRS